MLKACVSTSFPLPKRMDAWMLHSARRHTLPPWMNSLSYTTAIDWYRVKRTEPME